MPAIHLSTMIRAPRSVVFDLARSIDAHLESTSSTQERAIAGVTRGMVKLNDEVTWEARHLGVRQRLTFRITAFDPLNSFQDTMIAGAFKTMIHDHEFAEHVDGTLMRDRFEFASPLGFLGYLVDRWILTQYMRRFLIRRNDILKQMAESGEWRRYIGTQQPSTNSAKSNPPP
jgi:ligand-binding SRPBCC domain-containing protein